MDELLSRRTFLATSSAILVAPLASTVAAQTLPPGQWEMLGERQVSLRAERDVIPVGAREGAFQAVMIDVLGRQAIEILSFALVFGDGERREFAVREVIAPRGRTRVIDLPGGVRLIRRVELTYRCAGGARRGRGHVRVFGMR